VTGEWGSPALVASSRLHTAVTQFVEVAYIVLTLISYGWYPDAAQHVAATYPARCVQDLRVNPFTGSFWPYEREMKFGQCAPSRAVLDHEAHHAWHFGLDGIDQYALRDSVVAMSSDDAYPRARDCARSTRASYPTDTLHWNHYLLACLGRDKTLLPPAHAAKYFAWLMPPLTRRIYLPLGAR
jgi:hypothetical protein